jgi:hypothetical protein
MHGRKTQQEAVWLFVGSMQGKADTASKLMKQRRYREVARCIDEMKALSEKFDSLPMSLHGTPPPVIHPQSGGLPAGDKD